MVKNSYSFVSPDVGPAQFIDLFSRFYGPTMNAFEAAQKQERKSGHKRSKGGRNRR